MDYSFKLMFMLITLTAYIKCFENEEFCDIKGEDCKSEEQKDRYLFYDINPPEGFNLRRDVYMRFAIFAHNLKKSPKKTLNSFKLVLPPWINLYHWKRKTEHTPWSHFFDLKSMQNFAPVIEMHQFFNESKVTYSMLKIDEVYILQHFQDMFKTGKFEDKMEIQGCNADIQTNFFYYDNITSDNISCLSFHGHASQLSPILKTSTARTILFDHAEVALHDRFGDKIYWQARRSMRFSKELQEIAEDFRLKNLNSSNKLDGTELRKDWRDEKPRTNVKGGPYLSVHLRRRDFAWGRPTEVPSIESAAKQIKTILNQLNLGVVFVATDAPQNEYDELCQLLVPDFSVKRYVPDENVKKKYKDGAVAIIDQIICSHAKYFVGTHESTFSFRIQEEREILGFPTESTFNRLCGENKNCDKPSVWKIVY